MSTANIVKELTTFTPQQLEALRLKDPRLYAEVELYLNFAIQDQEREKYEDSLIAFFERAWREIDPASLSINWHHIAVAEALEDITWGRNRNLIINIPPRHTKALDSETPVFTTWGWKPHGEIEAGDFVFAPDGRPVRVTGVSPKSIRQTFEVKFDDGTALIADAEHLWAVERDYIYGGPSGTRIRRQEVRTTAELIGSKCEPNQRPDRIPLHDPIQMPPKRLLIDPYILGAWLGDGSTGAADLTVGQEDIEHFSALGRIVRSDDRNGDGKLVYRLNLPGVQKRLRILDLLGNKHIPEDYLEASADQRLELLRGLMDTDGTATKDGQCRYVTKLKRLGDDVAVLLRSLGIKAHQREAYSELLGVRYGPYQELAFRQPPGMSVFNLARKQAKAKEAVSPRARGRYVVSVEQAGERVVNCIKVEGELYLAGRDFITTHNTILVNVIWPAWTWAQTDIEPLSGPQVKFLCVSYGATLSEEIALKMRRLVDGDWYQSLWGHRVKLQDDQKNRANFENTAGGARISNSIEGGILGRGGDIKIIDDPQTRKGADSEAERRKSLAGMSDLTTRVTDPRYAAQVLIMQRLHLQDATDWALKNWPKNTLHLMYPARFEEDRASLGDKRTRTGQLLWPKVWTEEELVKIESGLAALDGEMLSDYAIQGQLQQNPIARSGGIVNTDDWMVWPEYEPQPEQLRERSDGSVYIQLPQVSHVILSIDTAIDEKTTSDYNAVVALGVWHRSRKLIAVVGQEDPLDDGEQPRVIVMGAWRARCKLNDETLGRTGQPLGLVQRIANTARQFGADRIIIENKTRGRDVKNELQRQFSDENFMVQMFEPGKHGDKLARLHAVQPLFSQHLVYLPGNAMLRTDYQGRETVVIGEFQWAKDVMQEVSQLPNGVHDDYADAISQGLLTLRDEGFLQLTQEYVRAMTAERLRAIRRPGAIGKSYGVA